jgi:hypothetical protein
MQNVKYFNALYQVISHKDFLQHLFSYFMTMDLTDFNHRIIPWTQTKEDMITDNEPAYDTFIKKFYDQIVDIPCEELATMYNEWATTPPNNYQKCSSKTFYSRIRKWTGNSTPKRFPNGVCSVYNIKPEKLIELQAKSPKHIYKREEYIKATLNSIFDPEEEKFF